MRRNHGFSEPSGTDGSPRRKMPDWEWTERVLMRYQSVDCAPRVRLSRGGPGGAPTPEFRPRNPICEGLRLLFARRDYEKKGWRVANPKAPPAPSLGYLVM